MKRLIRRHKSSAGHIEIREAAVALGRSGIPLITQPNIEGEVRPELKAILREAGIARLQNIIVSVTQLHGVSRGLIAQEVCHRVEGEAADVFGDVVAIGAANLSAECERVTSFQPAQRIVQHSSGIAAALRFVRWTAKSGIAGDIEEGRGLHPPGDRPLPLL